MAFYEGNQLLAGYFRAYMNKTNAGMNQLTKIWNLERIVQHQEYLYIKLAVTNASSAPKYVYL